MSQTRVGISSFASPKLRSSVASESGAAADMLPAYSERFCTVEVDSAFSRTPTIESVERWTESTPETFRFSVRVPRLITHSGPVAERPTTEEFLRTLEPLGPRLGCVLFSIPTAQVFDASIVGRVAELVSDRCLVVWQVRHPTWFSLRALRTIGQSGGTLAVVDHLDSPVGEDLLAEDDLPALYLRFRKPTYNVADILSWGESITESAGDRDVYVYFRPSREATAYAYGLQDVLESGA